MNSDNNNSGTNNNNSGTNNNNSGTNNNNSGTNNNNSGTNNNNSGANNNNSGTNNNNSGTNNNNSGANNNNSGTNNNNDDGDVLLTPVSQSDVWYDDVFAEKITSQLTAIGHPSLPQGSYYNCHGWSLGYKVWLNVRHTRNEQITLQQCIEEKCANVTTDDIFTQEMGTYARSNNKVLQMMDPTELELTAGNIVAYYRNNQLTHTARLRENEAGDLLVSCKLGSGHVVEYREAELFVGDRSLGCYGDLIDYYFFE
jgi:hypothetical protein